MSGGSGLAKHNPDVVLSVRSLSKKFSRNLRVSISYGVADICREVLGIRREARTLRKSEFWAVHDIDFDLRRGECLGLVGRNGSGKSTLLRLISGIIKPDTGSIAYRGRMAALIALGAGFNPVLTGRENVITNLAILGLSRAEVRGRLEAVLDFAEIGDAIDAPLQTYSSGMAARLGFACAIHTTPDILLIDEVLSVGDAKFRGKCYRKLYELRQSGTATVLVTHNVNAILSIADRVVYLSKGKKVTEGDPATVMSRYEEDLLGTPDTSLKSRNAQSAWRGEEGLGVTIESIGFFNDTGFTIDPVLSGRSARMSVRYTAAREIGNVGLGILVRELADESDVVLNLHSERDGQLFRLAAGTGAIDLIFPHVGLKPGLYTARIYLSSPGMYLYDLVDSYRFRVAAMENMSQCLYFQPREWRLRTLESQWLSDGRSAGRAGFK
jgi:lipopolysaccharide transport system ATP-binding protein